MSWYSNATDHIHMAVHGHVMICDLYCFLAVSGDANFVMDVAALTIGGFTQPGVARNLIELQASVEKGPCQRFLWIIPQPTYGHFHSLKKADETFTDSLGKCRLYQR